MIKIFIKFILAAIVVVASGMNVYNSQKDSEISDVVLVNVEALALIEEVLDNRSPSDTLISLELLGGGCTRVTYERLCAYGGSLPCTPGVHTEVDCLR